MTQHSTIGNDEKIHLAGLDLLRVLAISLVFLFHYPNLRYNKWVFDIKSFGWTGVDLFFVLSGYLIAKQLFSEIHKKNGISLKKFFIKRIFRILPAYLFIVAIYFCIPAFREREALPPLWKFLTFTQNIGLNPSTSGTFSHAWSLCVEEQFYFSFPLIIALLVYFNATKKGIYIIIALFIFTWLIRLYIQQKYLAPMNAEDIDIANFWVTWMYYPTYTRLDGLLIGISIAGLFRFFPGAAARLTKYRNLSLIIGIVFLAAAWFICVDRSSFNANVFGFAIVAFGYGFFVIAAISPGSILYKAKSVIYSNLATLSYSIYLSHKGVIHLCQKYFSKFGLETDSYPMFFICMIFSLVAAIIMRYTIEKPFLKLRDRFLQENKSLPISSLCLKEQ